MLTISIKLHIIVVAWTSRIKYKNIQCRRMAEIGAVANNDLNNTSELDISIPNIANDDYADELRDDSVRESSEDEEVLDIKLLDI